MAAFSMTSTACSWPITWSISRAGTSIWEEESGTSSDGRPGSLISGCIVDSIIDFTSLDATGSDIIYPWWFKYFQHEVALDEGN
jgi:hypothetical protein